jgi:hypothetical protein
MFDLLGQPIERPIRRARASAGLGAQTPDVQATFGWPAANPQAMTSCAQAPTEDAALADDEPVDSPAIELTLRDYVQQHLTDRGLSFVDAHNVQAGLYGADRLTLFDFTVADGDLTWLLYAGDVNQHIRDDLREWERIFGPGFTALIAEEVEGDDDTFTLAFRTLDGERVELR